MQDIFEQERKIKLAEWSEYLDSHEERIAQAIERLGERYLLHPSNRVQKRDVPFGSKP